MSDPQQTAQREVAEGHLSLTVAAIHDFARGATLLATGGGGDPYIGRLMAQAAIREYGQPDIIDIENLDDDAMVCMVAMLGAPTVLSEKGSSGDDIDLAIKRLSERIGKPFDALIPVEIGGVNSTIPVVAAARLGLPLVNADGMGRAFPEVQMVTMNFEGISATPFVIVDEHANSAIIETSDAKDAETFVRAVAIQMGLSCMVSGYAMTGAEAKRTMIHGTLPMALKLGECIAAGRKAGDPIEAVLEYFNTSKTYGFAREIFDGKLIDLRRETTSGFSVGQCTLEAFSCDQKTMTIQFQNEYLIALEGDTLRAVVPDLIMVVDRETAEPIPVEAMRYGQRVKVLAAAAPAALQTPQALKYISPKCFGLSYDYTPIEALSQQE